MSETFLIKLGFECACAARTLDKCMSVHRNRHVLTWGGNCVVLIHADWNQFLYGGSNTDRLLEGPEDDQKASRAESSPPANLYQSYDQLRVAVRLDTIPSTISA